MNNYIRIETSNEGLYLEIELGFKCNYKCSYCPPHLHTGKDWIKYSYLSKFINIVKPKTVLLVGGEPTYYPWYDQLISELKDTKIHITTNGSRPIEWWEGRINDIDVLTLSYHLECVDIDKFIKKLEYLTNYKIVTVNVSMIQNRFRECLEAGMRIAEVKNVYTSLKALNNINTGQLYNYTPKQLEIMSEIIKPKVETFGPVHNIYFYGIDENGRKKKLRAQTIISNKKNVYTGWRCWKGIQCIKLTADGGLYKATCELGLEPFGNIYDNHIDLPLEPTLCPKEYCFCLTDLKAIKKEKIY
jgi:organic radical activating enzyme